MSGFRLVSALLQELTDRTCDSSFDLAEEHILRQKLLGLGQRERVRVAFPLSVTGGKITIDRSFPCPYFQILLERSFYGHEWNVGSASTIRLLCQVDMFSLPVYLVRLELRDEQQNIFNDLIETEHYLLAELIRSAIPGTIGQKVRDIISEGIAGLMQDLTSNSSITVPSYMNELRAFLSPTELSPFLAAHFTCLLQMEPTATRDAVRDQLAWHVDKVLHRNLLGIVAEICSDCEKVLASLLTVLLEPTCTSWRYGLAMLNLVLSLAPELRVTVKSKPTESESRSNCYIYCQPDPLSTEHLSDLFTVWISKRSERSLHVMMLLARQLAYASGSEKVEWYRQWYKFQVAEMNYTLKSKADFQYAVQCLTALVPLETDRELLQVHIGTAIPAPPYCKVYVKAFKDASTRRELDCGGSDCESVAEVIVID